MPTRAVLLQATVRQFHPHPLLLVDMILYSALLFLPNLVMGMNLLHSKMVVLEDTSDWIECMVLFAGSLDLQSVLLWVGANMMLCMLLLALRRHVFYPMIGIMKNLYGMLAAIAQDEPRHTPAIISMRALAGDLARMAQLAHEYYHKHQDANRSLAEAREVIGQINAQQRVILETTGREISTQYQSVLAYANYLEEQIVRQAVDPALRYDFDDVSESSFNLKLIGGALTLVDATTEAEPIVFDVPHLMQQTMLALAPSLDRRAMRLTSAEVELGVMAHSNPAIIAHVLWMMLLGTIRYAADESTLSLRCHYAPDRAHVRIGIVVSELSPGRLTEDERGAFLTRQLQNLTPHMFAETIRIHGNIQLAEMLMKRLDGQLSISPLTSQSCEICLMLPASAETSA